MLPKILLTLAIAVIVWYGYQYVVQLQRAAAARHKVNDDKKPQVPEVEETVRCPACGTYVPARRTRHCGRADCPYPR